MSTFVLWLNSTYSVYFVVSQQGAIMKSLMQWNHLPAAANEWIDRIEALAPLILQHRDHAEEHGATHPDVMARLFELGFSRLCVPRAFGGHQLDIRVISQILQRLAFHDASLSWQIMVQVAMGRLADYLPQATARMLYGDSQGFVVGAIHPAGEAIEVEGGYRLSGKWGFASGSAHAHWMVCTSTIKQETPTQGEPEVRMFIVPVDQCQMIKTWDTLGMRGTASNHFQCTNVWVPQAFSLDTTLLKAAPAYRESLAYSMGYYDFGTLAAMGTVLGVAKAALEHFRIGRTVPGDDAVRHLTMDKTGKAVAQVHAAQLLLEDAIDHCEQHGTGDGLSVRVGLAASVLNENAVSAVNQVFALSGASAVYKTHVLERCFRDIHVGSKHFVLSSMNLHGVGKLYLDSVDTNRIY
jgi:alkylation response protein AidB-like acyl-CoA dehydrogenase